MRASVSTFLTVLLATTAISSSVRAENDAWKDWNINGYNTLRHDYYDIDGDQTASPFAFHGGHSYDEWSLNASKNFSPFRRMRIQTFGVLNDSDYRLSQTGFVPERLSIFYEDGEARVPWRIEVGDYYNGISYRTQQRMMKGVSLELQPDFGGKTKHSIVLFDGSNLPYYHTMDWDDDATTGASWLMESPTFGRLAFNGMYNTQDEATATLTGTNNDQIIGSAAWEKDIRAGSQNLNVTGELAFFDGDYGMTKDVGDTGAMAEFSGYSTSKRLPVDYRLRYERYGTDFRPNGALITPDRQSYEAFAGWRFDTGMQLRGRAQRFEDSFDSTNQQDTDILGVQLLGPVFGSLAPDVTGSMDLFTQEIEDDLRTVDREADTFSFSLSRPFSREWTGELSGFFQNVEDAAATNADSDTRQIGLGVYHPIEMYGFTGTIHPGIVLRDIDYAAGGSVEWEPAFAITLADDQHRVSANYGYLRQNRTSLTSLADTAIQNASFDYSYSFMGNHEVGFSASYFDRNIDASLDTDAYRVGAYWTVHFNKPSHSAYASSGAGASAFTGGQVDSPLLNQANLNLLTQIVPGTPRQEAKELLGAYNITSPAELSGAYAYEVQLLQSIPSRQRLVLDTEDGRVAKTALLIDTGNIAEPRSLLQTYERIKEMLVREFGKPATVIEEGNITGNTLAQLATSNAIRIAEWEMPSGTLRLGLPRPMEGAPRIEIHFARSFPAPRNPSWGMNIR